MSDALLRFENVTKSYGDFTVFSDISLEVHEKEVVSIIGSSGSGKTTTAMRLREYPAALHQPAGAV